MSKLRSMAIDMTPLSFIVTYSTQSSWASKVEKARIKKPGKRRKHFLKYKDNDFNINNLKGDNYHW